jgi:hypothetical protein
MSSFKVTFKNKIFRDISEYHLTEIEMKMGALPIILQSGMKENGYELIDICKDKNE